jgi:BirA family biotin operon repressor/biotin-[acetyl-CoA-carboxylase] ligase
MKIRQYTQLDSTNNECKRLIKKDPTILNTPLIVWSETQTHGRGSHNRHWYSNSKEGLYYSFCYKPNTFDFNDMAAFNQSIATIIINTIKDISNLNAHFKPPNDVFLNTKKIAGILIEMNVCDSNKIPQFIIIGMGLNINQHQFPNDLAKIATSIRLESGHCYQKLSFIMHLSTILTQTLIP